MVVVERVNDQAHTGGPGAGGTTVRSVTHSRFGASAVKSRRTRSAGRAASGPVGCCADRLSPGTPTSRSRSPVPRRRHRLRPLF